MAIEYANGAKRSDLKPMYRKLPFTSVRRVALALSKGSVEYDTNPVYESNWQQGGEDFAVECWDHLLEHALKAKEGIQDGEDHLAHLVCNALFLMWFEDTGVYYPGKPPAPEQLALPYEPEPEDDEPAPNKFQTLLKLVGVTK